MPRLANQRIQKNNQNFKNKINDPLIKLQYIAREDGKGVSQANI